MAESSSFYDLKNLDHAPDIAIALGNMVVTWAYAEAVLTRAMAITCGMNVNMATHGYYRIPTFEARTKFIRALIPEWETKCDKDAINRSIEKISALAKTRNDWIHGLWVKRKATSETSIFDFRSPESKGRRKPVKAADINNHVEAVRRAAIALDALIPWEDIAP